MGGLHEPKDTVPEVCGATAPNWSKSQIPIVQLKVMRTTSQTRPGPTHDNEGNRIATGAQPFRANVGACKGARMVRTSLPWLDGARCFSKYERPASNPRMPGSFSIEKEVRPSTAGSVSPIDDAPSLKEVEPEPSRGRTLSRDLSILETSVKNVKMPARRAPPESHKQNFSILQPGISARTEEKPSTEPISDNAETGVLTAKRPIMPSANPSKSSDFNIANDVEPDTTADEKSDVLQQLPESIARMEALVQQAVDLAEANVPNPTSREWEILTSGATAAISRATALRPIQPGGYPPGSFRGGIRAQSPTPDTGSESSDSSTSGLMTASDSEVAHIRAGPSVEVDVSPLTRSVPEPKSALLTNAGTLLRTEQPDYNVNTVKTDWAVQHDSNNGATPRAMLLRAKSPRRSRKRGSAPRRTSRDRTEFEVANLSGDRRSSRRVKIDIPPRSKSLKFKGPGSPSNQPRSAATLEHSNSDGASPTPPQSQNHNSAPGDGGTRALNWGRDKYDEKEFAARDELKGKNHVTIPDGEALVLHRRRRQPVARNWSVTRKRSTAFVACINTMAIGLIVGIYAGEVPAIQYALYDTDHTVILGNVVLYACLALTTFCFWPLPLLHGRKPYNILALALALPLQFPQALIVGAERDPEEAKWRAGLLASRAATGFVLGFAHINCKTTLLDLYGASLQSSRPHGEVVVIDDIRRHGGGMGLWLGFWSWCFIGSLALGFMIGAEIIGGANVSWGFYVGVILVGLVLMLNVLTPETRRASHRRTVQDVELKDAHVETRVARGEISMHCFGEGPKYWWQECYAGVYLQARMLQQPGFLIMALYLGWIYGEIILVIIVLGNLLSTEYQWRPDIIGLGVSAIAIGALISLPNTKANYLSTARTRPQRTDSMTFEPRVSWTSHLVRRAMFMIVLPLVGLGYTFASSGRSVSFMAPILLAAVIGYFSILAISECHGLIMETFDTSDLQPGANSRHRLQSLPDATRRKRTNYTSYPRVSAGLFASQTFGFAFAAIATGVGGAITRAVGAQKATGITAGVLFLVTILLTVVLWRFKSVKVIPDRLFGGSHRKESTATTDSSDWRAVIVGCPSGTLRRMSLLELGSLSRWTEIRRLNRLLNRSTTQPLVEGWR